MPKTNSDIHSAMDITKSEFTYTVDEDARTVTLNFTVGAIAMDVVCPLISTEYIGMLNDSSLMKKYDGSALTIDKDIYQNCRETEPRVGPFENINRGNNTFTLRPNSHFNWEENCIELPVRH